MKYRVILEANYTVRPRDYEISAALLIADYFKSDVTFLRPIYMKTPDLLIKNRQWELKSPIGNSKNTIHNIFKSARKQSDDVIIDLRRCKMREPNAISKLCEIYKKRRRKDCEIIIIKKNSEVVDIKTLI